MENLIYSNLFNNLKKMIYKKMTEETFACELSKATSFTYEGAKILFNYLESVKNSMEFNVFELKKEYKEYDIKDFIKDYTNEWEEYYYRFFEENEGNEENKKDAISEFFDNIVKKKD